MRRVIAAVIAVSMSVLVVPATATAAHAENTPSPGQSGPRQPNGRPLPDDRVPPTDVARPTFASEIPLVKGSRGFRVKELQDRLIWMGYPIDSSETDSELFWDSTEDAVKRFQGKFWISPTGDVGQTTWDRLRQYSGTVGRLPAACTGERTLCVDKTQRLLRLVENGKVTLTLDARFGLPGTVTREGSFRVNRKSRDHWSTLYRTWMPFAMFFSGGQAVHYSPFFARDGYNGGSHGCIGLRDFKMASWLYDRIPMGTKVYVYWS